VRKFRGAGRPTDEVNEVRPADQCGYFYATVILLSDKPPLSPTIARITPKGKDFAKGPEGLDSVTRNYGRGAS